MKIEKIKSIANKQWQPFNINFSFAKACASGSQSAITNIALEFIARKIKIKRIIFDSSVYSGTLTLNENINKTFALIHAVVPVTFDQAQSGSFTGDGIDLFPNVLLQKGNNELDLGIDWNIPPNIAGLTFTAYAILGQAFAGCSFNGYVQIIGEYIN